MEVKNETFLPTHPKLLKKEILKVTSLGELASLRQKVIDSLIILVFLDPNKKSSKHMITIIEELNKRFIYSKFFIVV